eukprot:2079934-Rhodomonas_salina.1
MVLPYLTIAQLPAGGPAGGLVVTAPAGHSFPVGLLAVRPAVVETAPPPAQSKVLKATAQHITVLAASPFPAKGYVDVQLPDGSVEKVQYASAHLAPGAMSITLAGMHPTAHRCHTRPATVARTHLNATDASFPGSYGRSLVSSACRMLWVDVSWCCWLVQAARARTSHRRTSRRCRRLRW